MNTLFHYINFNGKVKVKYNIFKFKYLTDTINLAYLLFTCIYNIHIIDISDIT